MRQYNPRTGSYATYIPIDYEEKSRKLGIQINMYRNIITLDNIDISGKLQTGAEEEKFASVNHEEEGNVTDRLLGKVQRTDLWAFATLRAEKLIKITKPALEIKLRTDLLEDKLDGIEVSSEAQTTTAAFLTVIPHTHNRYFTWNLFVSAGSSFSPPPFNSAFLVENVFARGNPALKPERGLETSMGGGFTFPRCLFHPSLTATTFKRVTKDLVIWRRNSRGQYFPQNVGRAVAQGLEISLQTGRTQKLINIGAHLTLQEVKNDDKQSPYYRKTIPFQPDYYGSAQFTIHPSLYIIGLESCFSGRRYTSESNLDPYSLAGGGLSPYKIFNTWISRKVPFDPIKLRATLSVDNLLNEEYELLDRMPMPLRVWRINLELEWK